MNNGDIRVLLGSTAKCGAGMNAQAKMIALHHLDVPLRPSVMLQTRVLMLISIRSWRTSRSSFHRL